MENDKFEEYYYYLKKKIVCVCDECYKFKLQALQYFPDKSSEIEEHWNYLVHQ